MLKQRIITALVLIPVFLALLFYLPPRGFLLFTAVLALIGGWEWSRLAGFQHKPARILYLTLMAFTFFNSLFIPVHYILIIAGEWWLIALALVVLYPRLASGWSRGVLWRAIMGFLVLTPCWVAVNYIRNQQDGLYALLYVFVLIFGADTAAYFTGRRWGNRPLAIAVSPGKTIEGAAGAFLFTILLAVFTLWICNTPFSIWPYGIILSILTVFFSIVGDLFESVLKRQIGVKDSGELLPGHGGLLDRIDSLTAAAPIFALGAWLLGRYLH